MSPAARARLDAFRAGETGQRTRALARRLAGKSESEVRARMAEEVRAGRATVKTAQLAVPKVQTMTIWEEPTRVARRAALGQLEIEP